MSEQDFEQKHLDDSDRNREAEELSDELDEDIPSLGRKNRQSNVGIIVGFLAIVFLGLVALSYFLSPEGKVVAPKKREAIRNTLPEISISRNESFEFNSRLPQERVVPKIRPIMRPTRPNNPNPVAPVVKKEAPKGPPPLSWYDRKRGGGGGLLTLGGKEEEVKAEAGSEGGENEEVTGIEKLLAPTLAAGTSAALLPDRNFIIAMGTTLDCVLETAIDSTLSGLTTCQLTRDIYSDNGQVVLLDRGSLLTGQYTGGLKNGQRRLFVIWSRIKTPNGVVISLGSPAIDSLGRSGVAGWIDNHFMERFGYAILLSSFSDGLNALNKDSGNSVTFGSNDKGSTEIIKQMLADGSDIPPTLVKNQGTNIKVMVARDLDFSSVYTLEVAE